MEERTDQTLQEKVKPYQVDYKRDGVVSNIIVLASSVEEALEEE